MVRLGLHASKKGVLQLRALILAITSLIFVSSTAVAREPCKQGVSILNPIQTTTKLTGNLPLIQPITVFYKDNFYRIPLGYLTWWGTPKTKADSKGYDLEGVNEFQALAFHFRMPELRFSETNEMSDRNLRSCENGRPVPGDNEHIVKVIIEEPRQGWQNLPDTPVNEYKSVIRVWGEDTIVSKKQHGLIRFHSSKYPDEFTIHYRSAADNVPEAYMECSHPEKRVPNPNCWAKFYYPKEDRYMQLWFPDDKISQWKEFLAAAHKLMDRWKIKNLKEIERLQTLRAQQKTKE